MGIGVRSFLRRQQPEPKGCLWDRALRGPPSSPAEISRGYFKGFSPPAEPASEGVHCVTVLVVMKTEMEGLPVPQSGPPGLRALPCTDQPAF